MRMRPGGPTAPVFRECRLGLPRRRGLSDRRSADASRGRRRRTSLGRERVIACLAAIMRGRHSNSIGIGGASRSSSHTTAYTGPYTAVRRIERSSLREDGFAVDFVSGIVAGASVLYVAKPSGFTLRMWRQAGRYRSSAAWPQPDARRYSPLPPFRPSASGAGLLCPLLTSAPRSGRLATPSVPKDTMQTSSWVSSGVCRRAPAGFTALALDGYGLRDLLPARPAKPASLSDSCSSSRDFAPRFLQTACRQDALALRSCLTSIRLHRGLAPPRRRTCPAHSTTARAVAASGGRARARSLTSNPSRASLRHANNDGICVSRLFMTLLVDGAAHAHNQPFVRPAGGVVESCWGALRPDPSRRPRRAGRVKSAASWRRERSHAQLALASEHGEHLPFDAPWAPWHLARAAEAARQDWN